MCRNAVKPLSLQGLKHSGSSVCKPSSVLFLLVNNRDMTTGRFTGWWYSPRTYTFFRQVRLFLCETEINPLFSLQSHNLETLIPLLNGQRDIILEPQKQTKVYCCNFKKINTNNENIWQFELYSIISSLYAETTKL